MNPELRDRSLMVGLLLIAWAVLVYLKTVLNAAVLPDLNAIIAQVQVLMGGVVGYHVGTGAGQPAAPSVQTPAPPAGVAGFATVRALVVLVGIALGLSLAGCASLTDAGHVSYTIEPVIGADGKATGDYKYSFTDGKEFSSRSIGIMKTSTGIAIQIEEGASSAFQGQAIAGKALSVLPSFAAPILNPGPAVVVPQLQQQLPLPANTPVAPASGAKS